MFPTFANVEVGLDRPMDVEIYINYEVIPAAKKKDFFGPDAAYFIGNLLNALTLAATIISGLGPGWAGAPAQVIARAIDASTQT